MSFLQSFLSIVQKDLFSRAQEVENHISNMALNNPDADKVQSAVCHKSGLGEAVNIVNCAAQWLTGNPAATSFPDSFVAEVTQLAKSATNGSVTRGSAADPTAPIDPAAPITVSAASSVQN